MNKSLLTVLLLLSTFFGDLNAQEQVVFKGQTFFKYPYPLEIKNHFYDFNMDDPENGDGFDIPPYPFALKDGDYLAYFGATETDSAENIGRRLGAKFAIRNGKFDGICEFYHYRRIKNSDSLIVEMKGQYLNGEKQGVWMNYVYSEYGLLTSTSTYNYKNGLFEGAFLNRDYCNNTISGNFVNNRKEGLWNYRYCLYNYKEGKRMGLQIDTCGLMIVKYEYDKDLLSSEIKMYNRYTGNLEFLINHIVKKTNLPYLESRFSQCFDGDPVLKEVFSKCEPLRALKSFHDFDLTIFNQNAALKTISYYSHPFSKQNAGYIKEYEYLDSNNKLQKLLLEVKYQKSENTFVNEVRSTLYNKEQIDVVGFDIGDEKEALYQFRFEQNKKKHERLLNDLLNQNNPFYYEYGWVGFPDIGSEAVKVKYEYSLSYLERKFGKLYNGILTDSILYVDTAKIALVKKRYYFGENQVQQVAEIFPKKGKPYLYNGAVITKQKGKPTMLQITKGLYNTKNPRIELIYKFDLSDQEVQVESSFSVKLKSGKRISPSGVYLTYPIIMEERNEENLLFSFEHNDDEFLYVDGRPYRGSIWMYDSLINETTDSLINKQQKSISYRNNTIRIVKLIDTSYSRNFYKMHHILEPYQSYSSKSATYVSFLNGLKDGLYCVITEKENDSFYINIYGKYLQGKWSGVQFTPNSFRSIFYEREVANCLVTYVNGEKEGMQKFIDYKESQKLVLSKNLGNDQSSILAQISEFVKAISSKYYNSIATGAVSGNYISDGNHSVQFDFDHEKMGDTIILKHLVWSSIEPRLTERIFLDKFGNGFIECYSETKDEKTFLDVKYIIKDHYLSDSIVAFFADGKIGKVMKKVRDLNFRVEKKIEKNKWSVVLEFSDGKSEKIFEASYDAKSGEYFVGLGNFVYIITSSENKLIDYIYYNKAGIKIAEGQELKGKKHGQWNYYNVDGNIYCSVFYENDESGKQYCIAYDENGKQNCSGLSGSIYFDAECEALIAMPALLPGIMNDEAQSKSIIKNGDKYVWLKMYRYNKNIFCEGWYNFSKHEKDSVWKFYSYNGTLKEIGTYKNDLKEGRWIYGNLTGINYLDNRCFDASDSLFIQTQMRNLEFTQTFYQKGERIKEIRNKVNLNKIESFEGKVKYWFLPIENIKLLTIPEERYKYYFLGNPIDYMLGY